MFVRTVGPCHPWQVGRLEDGRLVPLLEDWSPPISGLRLYYSGRRHTPAALRAFIEVVRESS